MFKYAYAFIHTKLKMDTYNNNDDDDVDDYDNNNNNNLFSSLGYNTLT